MHNKHPPTLDSSSTQSTSGTEETANEEFEDEGNTNVDQAAILAYAEKWYRKDNQTSHDVEELKEKNQQVGRRMEAEMFPSVISQANQRDKNAGKHQYAR